MPSGQLLYSRRDGKEAKFWISDLDGKNAKVIGPSEGVGVSPAVTPDSKYIVFNWQKAGSSRIWRMDADGANAVQLSDEAPGHADFNPQLMADGKTVIFHRQTTNYDRSELMKVSVEGNGAPVRFYSEDDRGAWGPRLSRDGSRIAFTTYDLKNFEKKVVVATLNGNSFGQIEREFEYNLINQIQWAPDNKSLIFLTSRAGFPNLWSQPIDGSDAKPLTDFNSGQIFNFTWSNDGKEILLARGTVNNELILIRDASNRRNDIADTRPAYGRGTNVRRLL
jgi:Tol biopolymer transport system component